jgi:predicted MFS family arabinose efflux permease
MFAGPLLGGVVAARFGFESVFLTIGLLAMLNLIWVAIGVREPANRPTP